MNPSGRWCCEGGLKPLIRAENLVGRGCHKYSDKECKRVAGGNQQLILLSLVLVLVRQGKREAESRTSARGRGEQELFLCGPVW